MKKLRTINEVVYDNKLAYKAARYLLKEYPKKYTGKYVRREGDLYLRVDHYRNGWGTFYRFSICLGKY